MAIDTSYSIVPAQQAYQSFSNGKTPLSLSMKIRQNRVLFRKLVPIKFNLGEPRGTYDKSSKMTYSAASVTGQIVNLYV